MSDQPSYTLTDPAKNAMDYAQHKATYTLFLGLTKWGLIVCVALLVVMAWTLV